MVRRLLWCPRPRIRRLSHLPGGSHQALKLGLLDGEGLVDVLVRKTDRLRSQNDAYWFGVTAPLADSDNSVPRGAPNLVCTTFVPTRCWTPTTVFRITVLHHAVSAAEYILNDYWTDGGRTAGFSYPLASLRVQVPNAKLLGAAVFCRVQQTYR